jgi:hypothetical protein
MSTELIIPFASALAGAIVGGALNHVLTAKRDRNNKIREQRILYLMDAYRRIENVVHRDDDSRLHEMEKSFADIQLLGSANQVRLAQRIAFEFASHGKVEMEELLNDLRSSLRNELGLESLGDQGIHYLRISQKAK